MAEIQERQIAGSLEILGCKGAAVRGPGHPSRVLGKLSKQEIKASGRPDFLKVPDKEKLHSMVGRFVPGI